MPTADESLGAKLLYTEKPNDTHDTHFRRAHFSMPTDPLAGSRITNAFIAASDSDIRGRKLTTNHRTQIAALMQPG